MKYDIESIKNGINVYYLFEWIQSAGKKTRLMCEYQLTESQFSELKSIFFYRKPTAKFQNHYFTVN